MVITLVTNQLNDWWDDPPLMLNGGLGGNRRTLTRFVSITITL
jgi:hypothetical protein